MRFDAVQKIKEELTLQKVLEFYGFSVNKRGFMRCPFHQEKTPSLKVYNKNRSWKCFGCGAGGDEISFVQQLFSMTFPDALKKIDLDFGLNLYGEHSFEDIRRSHRKQQYLQAKREREKREKEQAEKEYWKIFDEWKRLDDNKRKYAPKTPAEEWHPLFVEALQKLAYQEYLLDIAETRRWNCE